MNQPKNGNKPTLLIPCFYDHGCSGEYILIAKLSDITPENKLLRQEER